MKVVKIYIEDYLAALALKWYNFYMVKSLFIMLILLPCMMRAPLGNTLSSDNKPILGFTKLATIGIEKDKAEIISEQLRKEIDASGVYKTLEFLDIATRLAEQTIPTPISNVQSAVMAGQILGANFLELQHSKKSENHMRSACRLLRFVPVESSVIRLFFIRERSVSWKNSLFRHLPENLVV